MNTETELNEPEEICGKSNCDRPKLEDNVYCQYHYDIIFGYQ